MNNNSRFVNAHIVAIFQVGIAYIVARDWNIVFASLLRLNVSSSGQTLKQVQISLGHHPR